MAVKIRERPKGSGDWWVYIDHHGKRKAKKIGKDKRLAREVANKIEAKLVLGEMDLGENQEDSVPTLKGYVHGWTDGKGDVFLGWYDKVAGLKLKYSTRQGYRRIIEKHLLPKFGGKKLDEITSRMIGDYIYLGMKEGWRASTARNIKNCLSSILQHAYNPDGYIPLNPARGIPISKPEDEVPAREPDPLSWEERDILEAAFWKHSPRFYPLVVCGFRTGLRIGELIALQWQDLDFHNKLLLVQRNVARGKITTPKSVSSERYVRMTSQLIETLKEHRKALKEVKLRKKWNSVPEWVFPNQEGGFINYGNFIYRIWNPVMEKSGLRRRTPHDMRHTYATLRLSKGDSLAEVSKEMGHSTTEITYRTYYKWLPKESRSDIDELDRRPENKATIRNLYATKNKKGVADIG